MQKKNFCLFICSNLVFFVTHDLYRLGVGCEKNVSIILFFCPLDVRNSDLTLLITVSPFYVYSPLQP